VERREEHSAFTPPCQGELPLPVFVSSGIMYNEKITAFAGNYVYTKMPCARTRMHVCI